MRGVRGLCVEVTAVPTSSVESPSASHGLSKNRIASPTPMYAITSDTTSAANVQSASAQAGVLERRRLTAVDHRPAAAVGGDAGSRYFSSQARTSR